MKIDEIEGAYMKIEKNGVQILQVQASDKTNGDAGNRSGSNPNSTFKIE